MVAGSVDLVGGHHGLCLCLETVLCEPLEVHNAAVCAVEAKRDVRGSWERRSESLEPQAGVLGRRHLRQQEEVPPPVGRVVRTPHDEVVVFVVYLTPAALQQRDVGPESERDQVHGCKLGAHEDPSTVSPARYSVQHQSQQARPA